MKTDQIRCQLHDFKITLYFYLKMTKKFVDYPYSTGINQAIISFKECMVSSVL